MIRPGDDDDEVTNHRDFKKQNNDHQFVYEKNPYESLNVFIFCFSGVSFTSRQFSRIRIHEAEPGGNYFVMVEAMQNIRNLTLEMKLIGIRLK